MSLGTGALCTGRLWLGQGTEQVIGFCSCGSQVMPTTITRSDLGWGGSAWTARVKPATARE